MNLGVGRKGEVTEVVLCWYLLFMWLAISVQTFSFIDFRSLG